MPESLVAEYEWNDTVAFWLQPGATGPRASVSFDTTGKRVLLDWHFELPGSEDQFPAGYPSTGLRKDAVSVSFQPTAICAEAGQGATFFVAGWSDRGSQTVIERWEVKDMAVGTTIQPDGTVVGTLTLSYDKSIVLLSQSIGPARCLASHFTQGRLWMLEDSAPHRLLSIDPADGSVTTLADTTTFPDLAAMHSFRGFYIEPTAPSGGGFYLYLLPEFDWEFVQDDLQDPQSKVFFTRDQGFDGTVDEQLIKTLAQTEAAIDYEFDRSDYH